MTEVIGVDFDGVKVSFMDDFPVWHNQKYGSNIRSEDLNDYNVATAWGETAEYWEVRISEFAQEYQRLNPPTPLPYSVEVLGSLAAKHELVVITARPESERDIVEGVVDTHFPGVYEEIIMRGDDVHFFGMRKGEIAKAIGVTVLIDDHYINTDNAEENGVMGILFGDYGWNRAYHDGRLHARDWREVHGIIGH